MWATRFIFFATSVNALLMVGGFFRVAKRDKLLAPELVGRHVWEHTIITVVAVSNLDTLNLLAWRDGSFNGPYKDFAEHFQHIGAREWGGAQTRTGTLNSADQISAPLYLEG